MVEGCAGGEVVPPFDGRLVEGCSWLEELHRAVVRNGSLIETGAGGKGTLDLSRRSLMILPLLPSGFDSRISRTSRCSRGHEGTSTLDIRRMFGLVPP